MDSGVRSEPSVGNEKYTVGEISKRSVKIIFW